jgi:hypothetical protein
MEAPVNIVVESPDGEKAALVGRAIAQGLKENYGLEQVVAAHLVHDSPGFRAWVGVEGEEKKESLLDAMKTHNPGFFQTPVTILSREAKDASAVDFNDLPQLADRTNILSLGAIGEKGVTAEEVSSAEDAPLQAQENGYTVL